jgi:hypothetical protein
MSLKKHSTVASFLSFAFDLCRSPPLDVKLAISESALRLDVAGGPDYGECIFGDLPFRRASIRVLPL